MKIHRLDRRGWIVQPYRRAALKQYSSQYSQDNLAILTDYKVKEIVELQGFHLEEKPRSVYRVGKLYEALSSFSPVEAPYIKYDDSLRSGISLAWKCFGRPRSYSYIPAMPLTPESIVTMTSNPKGSAGLTFPGKKKKDSQMRALERAVQIIQGDKAPEPCLAFKRTQANDKTRLVWGFPYSMTVVEGLLACPLNAHFKVIDVPMAYAMTSMAIGSKLRTGSRRNRYCYSLDMSQFDASIAAYLINVAFSIIGSWFNLNEIEPTTGVPVRDILEIINRYFVTTPIVMPDGNVYKGKKHGVPSGSYFTQIVDSIVNVILCGSISHRFNLGVNKRDILVLGDDLLFFSNRKVSLNAISEYAKSHLKINVHGSEKSSIHVQGEEIHFLGRYWSNGMPDLPVDQIIAKMVYPESYRKYSSDPRIREQQVRLLVMSYASVYRSAWSIVERMVNPTLRNTRRGELPIDMFVYFSKTADDLSELDPTMLSGLTRYNLIYNNNDYTSSKGQKPFSGGQYLR